MINNYSILKFLSSLDVNSPSLLLNEYDNITIFEKFETINFDGIDIDYECYSTINNIRKQNDINVVSAVQNLKNKLQNKLITWAAFSSVWTANSFTDYRTTYLKILEYIDYVFWMTYNVSKDNIEADKWYSLVESRTQFLNFNTNDKTKLYIENAYNPLINTVFLKVDVVESV